MAGKPSLKYSTNCVSPQNFDGKSPNSSPLIIVLFYFSLPLNMILPELCITTVMKSIMKIKWLAFQPLILHGAKR